MTATVAPDGRVYISGPGIITHLVEPDDVTISVPATATRAGYGNGHRTAVAGTDPSRATSCLASEGRPATTPVNGVKVDRPTPAALGTASLEAAGTTGRAAHAATPRAVVHAGPPARHLHRI